MSEPTEIVQRVNRALSCSACGAAGYAACDCGAPYLPAAARAAKAIAETPNKSDRAIAAEIGVSDKTVGKARRATAESSAVEARVGLDGKARKQPKGWSRERYKAHRARKRDPSVEVRGEVTESDGSRPKVAAEEISRFAYKLIQIDIGLARELEHILQAGGATRLMFDLDTGIEIEESAPAENAPPPDVGADTMKAKMAALDVGDDHLAEKQGKAVMPKRRGRPPGSKNRPKPPPTSAVDTTATDDLAVGINESAA
jgi:hypothetical protein